MSTTVIGIGNAGVRILEIVAHENLYGLQLIAVDTHPPKAERPQGYETLLIGGTTLGAGGNPIVGQQAVQYSLNAIQTQLKSVKRLVIVCGFGGGTGTGAAPIIAQHSTQFGIPTTAIVSLPFRFEGDQRQKVAQKYIPELREYTHEAIVLDSNELIKWLKTPNLPSIKEAFHLLDKFMAWNLLSRI